MTVRGKALTPEERKLVVSIKKYFDQCKHKIDVKEPSVQKTADAICVGVATVKRIMADYNRNPKLLEQPPNIRGRRPYAIDVSYQENVRSYIREANQHGNYITLNDISNFLVENGTSESFHVSTLARTLDRWGFEFGIGIRTQHLKEKDYVVAARQRYLRQMRKNRISAKSTETIRPEVYLDES